MTTEASIIEIVAEHEKTLEKIRLKVRTLALSELSDPGLSKSLEALKELRDEAIHAHERDLPSLFQQIYVEQAIVERPKTDQRPSLATPYFGEIVVLEGGRKKSYLIGQVTFLGDDFSILDWKKAPRAPLFYQNKKGDFYEIELPGGEISGQVLSKRQFDFEAGEIVAILVDGKRFEPFEKTWQEVADFKVSLAGGSLTATRQMGYEKGGSKWRTPEITSLLDADQHDLLTRDPDTSLLILGGAGCGKTTVALHRLAYVASQTRRDQTSHQMAVIGPERSLAKLSSKLLEALGLSRVPCFSYDDFVRDRARYLFPYLGGLSEQSAPADVTRLKRHLAMKSIFPALDERLKNSLELEVSKEFSAVAPNLLEAWSDLVTKNQNAYKPISLGDLLSTFTDICKNFIQPLEASRDSASDRLKVKRVREAITHLVELFWRGIADCYLLFTNDELTEKVAATCQGAFHPSTFERAKKQAFLQRGQYGSKILGVDTLDMKNLDTDTPDDLAGTLDPEDYSLVLAFSEYCCGRQLGPRGRPHLYSHLVIDEAQEFSAFEYEVLQGCLLSSSERSLSIAGDALQKTDPSSLFAGWQESFNALGIKNYTQKELTTNYRCPAPIMALSRQILGHLQDQNISHKIERPGLPVRKSAGKSDGMLVLELIDELEDLMRREPQASIAIICENEDNAKLFYEQLHSHLPKIRLTIEDDFSFEAGLDVTIVDRIKGLEFDYVVIPDANNHTYGESDFSRRRLHVAVTRASHQLWLLGAPSLSVLCQTPK